MAKGSALLGGFIGSIIGAGLFILSIYIANTTDSMGSFIGLSIGGFLLAGFIAGIIARSPGKGALAGLFVSIFSFLLNAIVMVIIALIMGTTIFTVIFEVATLGLYEASDFPQEILIVFILIGLLIAFIFSAISAIFNVITGTLGGLVLHKKEDTTTTATEEEPKQVYKNDEPVNYEL
ncbi:MAG: hypothetical protein U9O98_04275 [Asgard group archaeon]|nr:hypothetical protein [Asgard group archaeon]